MLPKLKISAFLLKRLEHVKQQGSGCLFGVLYGEGTLLLLSFNVESSIGQLNYSQIQHQFPAELDLCGLLKIGDCSDAEAHLSEILKDVDITDNPILLQAQPGTLVGLRATVFAHGKLQDVPIPYDVMEGEQLYRDFCFTRLKCGLTLYTEPKPDAVRREMQILRKVLADGSLIFQVLPTRIYATCTGANANENALTNESLIEDVIAAVSNALQANAGGDAESPNGKKVGRKTDTASNASLADGAHAVPGCKYDVISVDVLKCKTRDFCNSSTTSLYAPSILIKHDEVTKVALPLEIEVMAMLCRKTKVTRLYDVLIESICRSLRLYERCLLERLEHVTETSKAEIVVPKSYHFFPEEFGHFISCAYPDGIADDDASMQDRRKRMHRHFALPVTRPYFRRANRVRFYDDDELQDTATSQPLLNTHIGLRPSGVTDGKQYLVQGNYYYYHYLQQQVQDKGWGCAYRSLQTICSWFRLQGYTTRSIPTHREVQEYLHNIGDKPASFVGSTQWIGSTELSMCLQGFLNVDSKIQHVTSGAELAGLASDLAMHFQTQGTPVMIGGGVLAHTIIGVDYCVQSGQVKFLILDPHYTGSDDLQTIQSKGWCGWKGVDFWDKKSYYNLCMPQRPIMY